MDSKVEPIMNILKPYNGLLMICASGIGSDLEIPNEWPEGRSWVASKYALLIDFRNILVADSFDLKIELVDKMPQEYTPIFSTRLSNPNNKLFIGSVLNDGFKIDFNGEKITVDVSYTKDSQYGSSVVALVIEQAT